MRRRNALDMNSEVVLTILVLIIEMRAERKYPTSKNISNRERKKDIDIGMNLRKC
jgi:hypothetical protein